jgi:hypothetical protein
VASALDEFLDARVPIQLGGLHDPFTAREERRRVTYRLLEILLRQRHPTVISTKGKLVARDDYLSLLQEMNVFVRFSAAGISESLRLKVDRRCDTFPETLSKIAKLSSRGVATGLRVQPVIPGFEGHALEMTRQAAAAGAKQVSFEYLKIPIESIKAEIPALSRVVGFDLLGLMRDKGLRQVGWDYMLTSDAKRRFVGRARTVCREVGVRFGAGDTDFIPWSDGDGCCACSGFFLSDAHQFRCNFVGAIKHALKTDPHDVRFDAIEQYWSPRRAVSTYLSSRSRTKYDPARSSDWLSLMAQRWNGTSGPYCPTFFNGVRWRGAYDSTGLKKYDATELSLLLNDSVRHLSASWL